MPNSVKYNTESEANALRVGNMHIGTGDVPKGPTSTTGFYNGINPPNGGYTIYENKAASGSSMTCPTSDAELISVTNGIADATYTTINECFTYFAGQNDKFVIHNPINPIVTDGLVLNVDASTFISYPRSGSTWYDLSGEGNNGTLTNGPTFDSNGAIVFDGSDDYIQGSIPTQTPEAATLEVLYKTSTDESFPGEIRVFFIGTSNAGWSSPGISLRLRDDKAAFAARKADNSGYWDVYSGATVIDGRWKHLVGTFNTTALKRYENGILTQQTTTGQNYFTGSTSYSLGGPSAYLDGSIAKARFYNKSLSQQEILQNYYQAPIVTDGLVFAMDPGNLVSFENGTTTTYSLTGSIEGTNINGLGFNSSYGGVFDFDGSDDRIQLGNQPTMVTSDITQEAWVNGDAFVNWHGIISNMSGWGTGFSLQIGITQNIAAMVSGDYLKTSWTPSTGVWYHIVATHRSSDNLNVLYVNGVQENTMTRAISYNTNAVTEIGVFYTGGSLPFNGKMGPLRTYNRALTAAEVAQNYNANINRFN